MGLFTTIVNRQKRGLRLQTARFVIDTETGELTVIVALFCWRFEKDDFFI